MLFGACSQNPAAWLLHPICNENVGLVRDFAVAIRGPHQPLTVGREHGERVEVGIERNALLPGSIGIDDVEIEVAAALGIGLVGGEDDSLAVGMEERREVGSAVVGHLLLVLSIGIHHPDFEIARTNESLPQQLFVVGDLRRSLGMLS